MNSSEKNLFKILNPILILILVSCGTVKIEKPVETYLPGTIRPKSSVIGFTAEARLSDIQKELNRQFSGLVYDNNSLNNNGGNNIMVKAWKEGDIALTMKDNVIIYRVPLRLWIKAGFKTTQLGITLSDYREVNGALALMFRTSVTLNPDWRLSTKTETTGYEWITEPVVKIAGINVPMKFVADLILQKNLKTISSSIDESIKEYLDLKPYALQAWKSLNQPIMLDDEYKVWLSIETSEFFSSHITAANGFIRIQSGARSVIETSVGPKPSVNEPGPLPGLQVSNSVKEGIVVNASLDIPFEEINEQASTYLVGMDFSQGKRKVKVEEVKIYGSKGKLVAETRLSGSFKGTIYFSGIPAFNATDSTLFLKDFDYDISTRNLLVKSAAWLYQGGFRNMMVKEMVWPMASDIKMIYGEINNTLKAYPLADGVVLKGQVNRLTMDEILITPTGVKPFISSEGRINLVFSMKN
ncbi:MAG: DUF4403 family protein [Lentimicrobium sp.]|nr:DUF4403 family protein [Lentimicrobium sp.]